MYAVDSAGDGWKDAHLIANGQGVAELAGLLPVDQYHLGEVGWDVEVVDQVGQRCGIGQLYRPFAGGAARC